MYQFKSTEPLLSAIRKYKKSIISHKGALYAALNALEKDALELDTIEEYVRAQEEEAKAYKVKVFAASEKRVLDAKTKSDRVINKLKGQEFVVSESVLFNMQVASTMLVFETILNHSIRGFSSKDGLKLLFQSVLFPFVYDHLSISTEGENFFVNQAPENLIDIIKDVRQEIVKLEERYGTNFSKERNWEAAKKDVVDLWKALVFDRVYYDVTFDDCEPWPKEVMDRWKGDEATRCSHFPHIYDSYNLLTHYRDDVIEVNGILAMEPELKMLHE